MLILERLLIAVCMIAGGVSFGYILWTHRLKHVWPKIDQLRITNPAGLLPGIAEVLTQRRVLANRPLVGFAHLFVFYGFVAYGLKSIAHTLLGLGIHLPLPFAYTVLLNVVSVAILVALSFLAYRRYFIDLPRLTHMTESGIVLSLIAGLMITNLLEHVVVYESFAERIVWWLHFLILMTFPSLIAYGKHLHLIMAPVNVVLRHMTELPGDRAVFGADFDMADEEKLEAEYARVGMPNGVADFSFHALFDGAACIECGRCNDACPSGPELLPRDHFVLALRDPSIDSARLTELVPVEILATCTQCRACDTVCPVGNRPSRAGLEMRGRLAFEGLYPPRKLKDGGQPITTSGNIFGESPSTREEFIEKNQIPIFKPEEHDILFVLGCQGGNSPEVQPVVLATATLLNAAGVKWGVLAEEQCWGEGLLQSSSLMEEWPIYWQERIEQLRGAVGSDGNSRKILTICPHCRDTIAVQYRQLGAEFEVVMHLTFLEELLRAGKLKIGNKSENMAVHHPCKVIHNDEVGDMDRLLSVAGIQGTTAANSPDIPRCCGGGGGGFLWDSPAHVGRKRFDQLKDTGQSTIVTGCPGCHRMLNAARDEKTKITDVATVLAERLEV